MAHAFLKRLITEFMFSESSSDAHKKLRSRLEVKANRLLLVDVKVLEVR